MSSFCPQTRQTKLKFNFCNIHIANFVSLMNMAHLSRTQTLSRKGNDTKLALIRSGVEIMTTYGYNGANLEHILKNVGVPKGSFYYYFKSKEDFGKAILDYYNIFFINKLNHHLLNQHIHSALDRIHAFYRDAKTNMAKYHFNRGCLVGEFMQNESLLPENYPILLNNILHQWQDKISACLQIAQQQHEIHPQLDSKKLACFFWLGWEGAVSRAKLTKNAAPLDTFIEQFITLIQSNKNK